MFGFRSILLSFCLSPVCIPLAAQIALDHAGPRLLSPQEGEAIVQAAWDLQATWDGRRGLTPKPDCSHFIHAVYSDAGFPYDYVPSREVFSGIDHFRLVTKPQPGDVIVWQGHIGIVINPKQHSFYSSLNSGFDIQDYQSQYWTARGIKRFYRFFLTDPPIPPQFVPSFAQATPPPRKALRNPMLVSQTHSQVLPRPITRQSPVKELAQKQVAPAPVQPAAIEQRPKLIQATDSSTQPAQVGDPVFVTAGGAPSKEEVLAAILRSADAKGERLLQTGLDSQASVGIVDRFRIASLNLQDTSGLARLELQQVATFQYGRPIPARTIARRDMSLSRQKEGWVLLMPQDLTCLSRHLAVIALHDHMATMKPANANGTELKTSLRLLNDLLSERSPGAHPPAAVTKNQQ